MPAVKTSTDRTPYTPRGAAWDLLHEQTPEVLISGPAGTGKSLACLFKMHICAELMPGFRGIICRRTRKSLTDSGLVTFERDVLPHGHPARGRIKREGRHSYQYPNGSEIVVGGLDESARVMSTDYDMAFVQEATEVSESSWEDLTTRLRNGAMPYQQLIADCNPDRPTHWLRRRAYHHGESRTSSQRTLMLESRHEDNPKYWDADQDDWTPEGRRYVLGTLESLSGPRKLRLRYGRWVRSEGVVYEGWDPAVHMIEPFAIPPHWPRLWSVDFGYTHPFVWQAWALDGDGRLYLYRQIYMTQRLVRDHAERIRQLTADEPTPVAIICDTEDREGRETLSSVLGMGTIGAEKHGRQKLGIQAVQERLRVQGDGMPRLYILRDSLDERDASLDEAKKPCRVEDEFDAYIMDPLRDAPVKENDDGMDAMRYLVAALDAPLGGTGEASTVLRA